MKGKRILLSIIFVLIIFNNPIDELNPTTVIHASSASPNKFHSTIMSDPTHMSFVPHEAISITSDADFLTYGFPGSGTPEDPYVIEGLNITTDSSSAIFIQGTTKYFVISNCYLHASVAGIYIDSIAPSSAVIVNNTCLNNMYYGIFLQFADSVIILNNTCANSYYGIWMDSSRDTTIGNNTIKNNAEFGIKISSSPNSIIENNSMLNNGLFIEDSVLDNILTYKVNNNWVNNKLLGYFTNQQDLVINQPNYGQIFLINCTNAIIQNQVLNNASVGIYSLSSYNLTISNSTCSYDYYKGIYILYSHNATIYNNTCNENDFEGIFVWNTALVTIANNTCINNGHLGIYLDQSPNSTVQNNNLLNNGYYFYGNNLETYLSYTIENNWVNNKLLGYFTNLQDVTIDQPNYGQLFLINCTGVTVKNQIFSNVPVGISVRYSSYVNISDNTFSDTSTGIALSFSEDSTIVRNVCMNNFDGIILSNSYNSVVNNNTCTNNDHGIFVSSSQLSSIANNTCDGNYDGIYLSDSDDITITLNIITNSDNNGIGLYGSQNAQITKNILRNNRGYGISLMSCESSHLYYNIFIDNNAYEGSQAYDDGDSANYWYNIDTKEGNYWSDWSGSGTYTIDGSSAEDSYPVIDMDDDGLNEQSEVMTYHTDPFSVDTDGDGYNDGDEVQAGTDPTDPNDYPTEATETTQTTETKTGSIAFYVSLISLIGLSSLILTYKMRRR